MIQKLLYILIVLSSLSLTACSNNSSLKYIKKAEKLMLESDYSSAVEHYNHAIKNNPNRADYYISLAQALILSGEDELVEEVLDQAYLNKDLQVVLENNKKIHILKGRSFHNLGKYELALEEYEKALLIKELSNINMDILLLKALTLEKQGLYYEAIDLFNQLILEEKQSSDIYAGLANSYKHLGNYEDAIKNYDLAIQLEQNNFEYYFAEYNLFMAQNNLNAANEILDKADLIEIKTDYDKLNKARISFYKKQYDKALEELNILSELGFTEVYSYIAQIYSEKKEYDEAIDYCEQYIQFGGSDVNVLNNLGILYMKKGDYKRALEVIEQGLEINNLKYNQVLRRNEIVLLEKLGRFDDARTKLNEYIKKYSDDLEATNEMEFLDMVTSEVEYDQDHAESNQ